MKIINATPHAINIMGDDNQVILTIEPSGILVRVSQQTTDARTICVDGIDNLYFT